MVGTARLRREQPDVTAVRQRGQRVDQCIHQVAVAIPPPEQDHVDDVVVVLIHELDAVHPGDRVAQLLVTVVVVAEFLHHVARFDAEPLVQAARILRLARGRAQ